jgi:hypothetical protein
MNSNLLTSEPRADRPEPLTIRFAAEDDELAVILAEEHGELRAALSLTDGRVVADPFRRTAHLIEMLRAASAGARAR